jgi:hypothetical protein
MFSYQQFQYDAIERQRKAEKQEVAKKIQQDSKNPKNRR